MDEEEARALARDPEALEVLRKMASNPHLTAEMKEKVAATIAAVKAQAFTEFTEILYFMASHKDPDDDSTDEENDLQLLESLEDLKEQMATVEPGSAQEARGKAYIELLTMEAQSHGLLMPEDDEDE